MELEKPINTLSGTLSGASLSSAQTTDFQNDFVNLNTFTKAEVYNGNSLMYGNSLV